MRSHKRTTELKNFHIYNHFEYFLPKYFRLLMKDLASLKQQLTNCDFLYFTTYAQLIQLVSIVKTQYIGDKLFKTDDIRLMKNQANDQIYEFFEELYHVAPPHSKALINELIRKLTAKSVVNSDLKIRST